MTAGGSYVSDPNTVPERASAYRQFNGLAANAPVPVDAVTASGSGLDPGFSVQNALDQAPRVAPARHLPVPQVIALVHRYTQGREWGFLGEPRLSASNSTSHWMAPHERLGLGTAAVHRRRHRDICAPART